MDIYTCKRLRPRGGAAPARCWDPTRPSFARWPAPATCGGGHRPACCPAPAEGPKGRGNPHRGRAVGSGQAGLKSGQKRGGAGQRAGAAPPTHINVSRRDGLITSSFHLHPSIVALLLWSNACFGSRIPGVVLPYHHRSCRIPYNRCSLGFQMGNQSN